MADKVTLDFDEWHDHAQWWIPRGRGCASNSVWPGHSRARAVDVRQNRILNGGRGPGGRARGAC